MDMFVYICLLLQQPTSSVKRSWYKYPVQFSSGTLSWLSIKKTELHTIFISSVGQRFASFLLQYDMWKQRNKNYTDKNFKTVHRTINTQNLSGHTARTFQRENILWTTFNDNCVCTKDTFYNLLQHYTVISVSTILGMKCTLCSYRGLMFEIRIGRNYQNDHHSFLPFLNIYNVFCWQLKMGNEYIK